jgi:hypothetical protein
MNLVRVRVIWGGDCQFQYCYLVFLFFLFFFFFWRDFYTKTNSFVWPRRKRREFWNRELLFKPLAAMMMVYTYREIICKKKTWRCGWYILHLSPNFIFLPLSVYVPSLSVSLKMLLATSSLSTQRQRDYRLTEADGGRRKQRRKGWMEKMRFQNGIKRARRSYSIDFSLRSSSKPNSPASLYPAVCRNIHTDSLSLSSYIFALWPSDSGDVRMRFDRYTHTLFTSIGYCASHREKREKWQLIASASADQKRKSFSLSLNSVKTGEVSFCWVRPRCATFYWISCWHNETSHSRLFKVTGNIISTNFAFRRFQSE